MSHRQPGLLFTHGHIIASRVKGSESRQLWRCRNSLGVIVLVARTLTDKNKGVISGL